MPRFTKRPTGLGKPDDYVFLVDGKERGRCYLDLIPSGELTGPRRVPRWHWTVYGSVRAGNENTLENAQEAFKRVIEERGR